MVRLLMHHRPHAAAAATPPPRRRCCCRPLRRKARLRSLSFLLIVGFHRQRLLSSISSGWLSRCLSSLATPMSLDHRRASVSYRAAASHPAPLVPLVRLVVTSTRASRQTDAHPPARPPSVTRRQVVAWEPQVKLFHVEKYLCVHMRTSIFADGQCQKNHTQNRTKT